MMLLHLISYSCTMTSDRPLIWFPFLVREQRLWNKGLSADLVVGGSILEGDIFYFQFCHVHRLGLEFGSTCSDIFRFF